MRIMYQQAVCIIILFWGGFLSPLQNMSAQERLRIVSYNVENLFDTKDNPHTKDDDFLPEGKMRWSDYRYRQKLRNITRVLTAIGEMESPALVGLIEIENDSVLYDLTRRSPLRAQNYGYRCTNSPDLRGVNVGLLYQKDKFKVIAQSEYVVPAPNARSRPTRNILHVSGKVVNGDTLDVFVCHFPSRREGKRASEPYRVAAARLLRKKVDTLFAHRRQPYIIIMGDFNDEPSDKSMSKVLQARPAEWTEYPSNSLVNVLWRKKKKGDIGTYKYRGDWNILDHFILNSGFFKKGASISLVPGSVKIFSPDFLCEEDTQNGGYKPFRTYLGPRYLGGFSDHFPIVMDLIIP